MADSSQRSVLLEFARRLPKVELHAHLHGCIRAETIHDLSAARGVNISPEQHRVLVAPEGNRSLSDCFVVFDAIHSVVSDLPAVRRIALEALEDMQRNNVRYAELRTTPRALPDGASRREYVVTVLRAFREFEDTTQQACLSGIAECSTTDICEDKRLPALIPRLLLSVDRGRSSEEAIEVAALAMQLREDEQWKPYVVGMDFSGNPTKGSFEDFRPAFDLARKGGLKVTAHCGEVSNDDEFMAVIDFRPERLGHAVVLGKEVRDALLALTPRIPIEVCPTSNFLTLALAHHGEHPTVRGWIKEGYPFSVNTDDPGVFETDLPTEFVRLASSHEIDRDGMARLACRAVQDIFDEELLPSLAESFRKECEALTGHA